METKRTVYMALILTAVLLLVFGMSAAYSAPTNRQFADSARVLLVITAVAVGIERFMEIAWGVVSMTKGASWPLNLIGNQIDTLTANLDSSLRPFQEQAQGMIAQLAARQKWTMEQIQAARDDLEKLDELATDLKKVAKDREQLQVFASAAAQYVNFIQAKYTVFSQVSGLDEEANGSQHLLAAVDQARANAEAEARKQARAAAEERFAHLAGPDEREQKIAEELDSEAVAGRIALAGDLAAERLAAGLAEQQALQQARQGAEVKARLKGQGEAQIRAAGEEAARRLEQRIADAQTGARELALQEGMTGDEVEVEAFKAAQEAALVQINADPARKVALAVDLASEAIGGMTDFVSTFKDNPGRRLISLYVAALIGVAIAAVLGLDVFQAVLGGGESAAVRPVGLLAQQAGVRFAWDFPRLGVAITGLLIGMGASPTHEVIRVLQEYKKNRSQLNVPQATTVDALVSGGAALLAPPAGVFPELPTPRAERPAATVRFIRVR